MTQKDTEFTKAELRYIRKLFYGEFAIAKITKASQLGGMVGLMVDNRDEAKATGEKWPLDTSITEKVFAFHGIPKETNYATYTKKYAKTVEKNKVKV